MNSRHSRLKELLLTEFARADLEVPSRGQLSGRQRLQPFAELNDSVHVTGGDLCRGVIRDIAIKPGQLFFGLRREDDVVCLHFLADVFWCSAARRARIRLAVTAREGSALSAS